LFLGVGLRVHPGGDALATNPGTLREFSSYLLFSLVLAHLLFLS
jgi:hypothetical protein